MALKALVDTSAWIEALRSDGDPAIRVAVSEATSEGMAVLSDLVRLELWNGARGASEQRMLRDLESELECMPTTPEVWETACDFARKCRARGLTVPSSDLLIYACARHFDLELIHADSHYTQIESVVGS